ncbi:MULTISPECIES: IS701 family transposase [Actinopolyspora]|uniref:IS701 family transposase n=1 Tax=Actinopolyspora TaxID=1849 RepID=UPI000B833FE1|nr:IS701 family transposase [Actinopolyspora saharensis]NHD16034.1 IS701 family transposase [Actinopolyspora sp. BKK2]NHE74752.1 IS701 family transposase [Actinopolyspora sp. BKK1]
MVLDVISAELEWLHARIAGRFVRSEPRARVREYVSGLVAGLERKNGWTLAEQAGEVGPDGMQRLLRRADWDVGGVRDDVRDYVIERLGAPDGVLIVDETGFIKKGTRSAGVQRQYSGTAGRTENCQIGTFLAYASSAGHALIDRELYLPRSWTDDRDRCRAAGVPDEVGFATKPQQAQAMIDRAVRAGVPFAWVTGDEAYGQVPYLRDWLEQRDVAYVLATKRNDPLTTASGHEHRADELTATISPHSWRRLSVGAGGHGPRLYDWARIPLDTDWPPGRGRWLLARRSISNPNDIAYYVTYGPRRTRLLDLAWTAGSRWHVEECFQQAKNDTGLDHYQARSWRAWYAHTTLSMLALAWLAASKTLATQTNPAPATQT